MVARACRNWPSMAVAVAVAMPVAMPVAIPVAMPVAMSAAVRSAMTIDNRQVILAARRRAAIGTNSSIVADVTVACRDTLRRPVAAVAAVATIVTTIVAIIIVASLNFQIVEVSWLAISIEERFHRATHGFMAAESARMETASAESFRNGQRQTPARAGGADPARSATRVQE